MDIEQYEQRYAGYLVKTLVWNAPRVHLNRLHPSRNVRCENAMERVAVIPPLQGQPGLIAYLCPRCGQCRSDLVPPRARTFSPD
jgi:hypothetical protein